MSAKCRLEVLLTGIARGRGGAEMMLELLAILHDKGILTESEVRQMMNVLAAEMKDFNTELRQRTDTDMTLKG